MPIDTEVAASLAYRKNTDAIWRGQVPEKYTRILPYVRGKRVVEIGAAEGVLALLMADAGHTVTAIEKREDRHREAVRLKAHWQSMGRNVGNCLMLFGDASMVFAGTDILVAVRVIYHLRDKAQQVIARSCELGVPRILLCGNKNRAARHEAGTTDDNLGKYNYYASIPGMVELLKNAGYEIETIVREGDPIVVGRHRQNIAA